MRLVLHFARCCRSLFTIFASWTVLETCTAENTSKIEPMDHIRGRRLVERVEQLVDTARRMAEMGLGYEAARLLKSAAKYSPDKGRAEEAKRILESWGVHEMDINDANAGTIRSTILGTLNRNRAALLNHKRVETLIAVGKTTQAAKIISDARKVKLTGESRDQQRRILNDLNLEREALNKANNSEALEALMNRSRDISRLRDVADFLRTAHPDSGNAMRKFIRQVYPETTRMQEQRDNERDRYRSFFARRLPENARPPAMRVEDDGERSRGREGGFSFLSSRSNRGSSEREEAALTIDELTQITTELAEYDRVLANEFAALAKRATTDEARRKAINDALQPLAKGNPIDAPAKLSPSGAFLKPLKQTDEASKLFDGDEVPAYKITLSPESIESLKKEPKVFVKAKFESGDVKLENVGVRLKGFIGSFRPFDGQNKNGFTVKFNAFKNGQRFMGLKKLQLNNAAQDSTYIRERLGYALFREAGLPAPRVGHATVSVNGDPFGLYVQVEASTEDFLARWFEDTKGDLYEGPTDISNWKNLDLDSDPKRAQRGLLMGFTEAAKRAEDTNDLTHLEDWVDLGHFARFMAMEILCDHWDGYLSPNNYRVYRNPTDRKFYFIPHGADQLFRNSNNSLFGSSRGRSAVVAAFRSTDEGNLLLEEAINYLLGTIWNPEKIQARIMQDYERIRPHIVADAKRPYDLFEVEERLQATLSYFGKAERLKRWQLMALDDRELEDRLSRLTSRSRWGR